MNRIIAFLIVLTFSIKAVATNYYVNDGSTAGDVYTSAIGNNGNPGTALLPFATLTHVVNTIGLVSGDTIFIDAGTYSDINLSLSVDNISIIGAGSDLTIFDNAQASADANRWANITGNNITIQGINITGYNYGFGGASAINISGVSGVQINDVLTDENKPGGGSSSILVSGGSQVDFQDGGANCNTAVSVAGGGVNVEGSGNTVTFDNYSFSNNSKSWQGGSGLYVAGDNTTTVTVTNSIFADNTNSSSSGGAGVFVSGSNLIIKNTCFTDNTYSYTGGPAYGGAISVARGATLSLNNCSFSGNSTSTSGKGGAISINTSFSGSGSAAVVNIDTCSFSGNSASSEGNDLYARVGNSNPAAMNVNECTWSFTALDIREANSATINIQNSGNPSATGAGINFINTVPATATPVTNCPVLVGSCYSLPCTNATPNGSAAQLFCSSDLPTIADLAITGGATIVWYNSSILGSAYVSTDPLINGTSYWAADETAGCDTSIRFEVIVTINDTIAPSGLATQEYCISDNATPTVADLIATGNNIQWYDALGNLLSSGDLLIGGDVYSASQESGLTGCESSATLDVLVSINDTIAPSGNNAQSFCLDANPLVSDLSALGNGVLWYSDIVNSNLLSSNELLIDGNTYYATQTNIIDGCESSTSLAIVVTLSDPLLDTTNIVMTQSACGNSDGLITGVLVSGGQPIYTWQWSNSTGIVSNSQDITNAAAGSYTVLVTDALGCQDSVQAMIISDNEVPIINVSSSTVINETCSDANGSIADIVVSGGSGLLAFEWSDGASVVSTDLILDSITNGDYSLTVTDANGCFSTAGPFAITDLEGPSLDLNSLVVEDASCNEANGSITGLVVNGGNGTLQIDWSIGSSSIGNTLDINNLLAGPYLLVVTDTNNCIVTIDTTLISDPVANVMAEDDYATADPSTEVLIVIDTNDVGDATTIQIISGPHNGTASVDLSGNLTYIPDDGFSGIDSLVYTICDEFCSLACDNATVYITVENLVPIHIPNGFSPNTDGFNDTFVIEGLEQYPNNQIIIFNRWGDEVFSAEPYLNDWVGTTTNDKLKIIGDQVTEGTYYYILDLHVEEIAPFNGFIELRRN